jgi:hypothetical protein
MYSTFFCTVRFVLFLYILVLITLSTIVLCFLTCMQATQWERHTSPAEGMAGEVTYWSPEDDEGDGEGAGQDIGADYSGFDDEESIGAEKSHSVQGKNTSEVKTDSKTLSGGTTTATNTATTTSTTDRKTHHRASSGSRTHQLCTLHYGRVTLTELTALSSQPKEGHLMKQSTGFFSFSSRWNRKYLVLDGLRLECYDKSEHYFHGLRKPTVMLLTLSTCTSFTDDDMCFIVKTKDEAGKDVTWTLAAPNHSEKNEWVSQTRCHIFSTDITSA